MIKRNASLAGLFFLFSHLSYSAIYPCNGAAGTFRMNPDNTQGGFVAMTATVDPSIFLTPESQICEHYRVDADGDGVRDDVEIFINNILSNTAAKNKSNERMIAKMVAAINQKEMIVKNDLGLMSKMNELKLEIVQCFNSPIFPEILVKMINTEQRKSVSKCDTIALYKNKLLKLWGKRI